MLTVTATRTRGIGRYVADFARAVAARARTRGDGLEVLGLERLNWIGAAGITRDIEAAVQRLLADAGTGSQAAWANRVRLRLAAAARSSRADLVHSPDPDATPVTRLGCPRIVTCHDLINMTFPEHYSSWSEGWVRGRRWLDRRRYTSADHIIAVSETTARDLVARLQIPSHKITVVTHGLDLARFCTAPQPGDSEARGRYGVADVPYLLCVGGGDWRKNAEGMLDALVDVRRQAGSDEPVLVWAGRLSASERARVERLAGERRIRHALRLIDWVPDADLWALFRGAIALLFVSRAEGFGYPVVEAMALGCPVVGANCSATAEIAGDAAWLVDPERPAMIADAAIALMRHADQRRSLIERGLIRCRAFEISRMADETLDVYRRVASPAAAA
jgi:alpha-1,3-rhamnosyl/mannosyltransferase